VTGCATLPKADFTLRGLGTGTRRACLKVDYRTMLGVRHAENSVIKKDADCGPSKIVPMSPVGAVDQVSERIDPSRLVFIDETWTKTIWAAAGWARVAKGFKGQSTARPWQIMTFLAALRHDRITGPWLIGRADQTAKTFQLYVEKVWSPLAASDIVSWTISARKKARPYARRRAAGARSSICRNTRPI